MPKKNVLCVVCNQANSHEVSLDRNDEVLLVCDVCGHAVKFPKETKNLNDVILLHGEENTKQVERRNRLDKMLE